MTSTYGEIRKQTAEKLGDVDAPASKPCRYCGEDTPYKTLSLLGARCRRCYDQFLQLGYSGSGPAPQANQAAWVRPAAKTVRHVPNQFSALAERMRQGRARIAAPKGASDDEVNALLREQP
jgi:hypothetical protein